MRLIEAVTGVENVNDLEKLKQELKEKSIYGEDWKPKQKGEEIFGKVVRIGEKPAYENNEPKLDKEGKPVMRRFVVLTDHAGNLTNVWESSALLEMFSKVKKGDLVGVTFLGKEDKKRGVGTFNRMEYVIKTPEGAT